MSPAVADPMITAPYRLTQIRRETRDTVTLALAPAGGGAGPAFAPGQFNMLYLFGVGEAAVSLSGDPDRTDQLIHTVRAVGPVTKGICALKRGGVLGVRGPFGNSWPVAQAAGRDVLLVAGGLGLAPLRPALYRLLARRPAYGRVLLLYGARTPADRLFRRELEQWSRRPDLEVEQVVDAAPPDWRGHVGVVTTRIARARLDPARTVALVCGPEVMMRFTLRELGQSGVAPENVYLSLERNMKCALGFCGHCQLGPAFVCRDGPVFRADGVAPLLNIREV